VRRRRRNVTALFLARHGAATDPGDEFARFETSSAHRLDDFATNDGPARLACKASRPEQSMLPFCLVVSSDPDHVGALQRAFRTDGIKLHGVPDLASLAPIVSQWRFDAVLCDVGSATAANVASTVRWLCGHVRAPVVVLAGTHDEGAELAALEAGATELVPRDTSARVLAVRLQRLIDLAAGSDERDPPRAVALGGLHLDALRGEALVGDRALRLTRGEFDLLFLLATRAGRFVDREAIVRGVGRGAAARDASRCADMHVCRIRRKLREAGASSLRVETVYGRGYALRLPDDGGAA
jgi:DNA-binding response OmpR family regulator